MRDNGSPNDNYFDGIGPADGYDDLICQFNNDLRLVSEAIQPVTLTGIFLDDGGNGTPFAGTDFASGPGGPEAIVRCCIDCDGNGNCSGCNGDTYPCTDFLKVCAGSEICNECTGCEPPANS